jgi:predicted nucleotidyltransferase component of viral defense system
MFTQTVHPETLEILKKFMDVEILKTTRLVGGTALALQLGHRFSVDIDLFGKINDFDTQELENQLRELGQLQISTLNSDRAINSGYLNDVKFDIVNYKYDWIEPEIIEDGIRMAGLKDIAAMKVSAIGSRGAKKDFYDLYFLLQKFTIYEIISFFSAKYSIYRDMHYIQSLCYFDDAEKTEQPVTFELLPWEKVKAKITKEIQNLDFMKL